MHSTMTQTIRTHFQITQSFCGSIIRLRHTAAQRCGVRACLLRNVAERATRGDALKILSDFTWGRAIKEVVKKTLPSQRNVRLQTNEQRQQQREVTHGVPCIETVAEQSTHFRFGCEVLARHTEPLIRDGFSQIWNFRFSQSYFEWKNNQSEALFPVSGVEQGYLRGCGISRFIQRMLDQHPHRQIPRDIGCDKRFIFLRAAKHRGTGQQVH